MPLRSDALCARRVPASRSARRQILQTHNMLSAIRPPTTVVNIETNMVWDGLFHAFTWIVTAVGLMLLFRAGRRTDVVWSGRVLLGSMLGGWGLFNFVEGLVDHHILHVHHVVERLGVSICDWAFPASGILLLVVGWRIARSSAPSRGTESRTRPQGPRAQPVST